MKFLLPVPEFEWRHVKRLAVLGALKYAQAQTEEKLHLPHAADESHAAQIRDRRDRCLTEWKSKKQRIADILAPYHPTK